MCKLVIYNCHFGIILYLCSVKRIAVLLLFVLALTLCGCRRAAESDLLGRSRVDALNREAFLNRYRSPDSCVVFSERALSLVADSLPDYVDGVLRACNNMAFAYFQMSDGLRAEAMLGRVESLLQTRGADAANGDIEWVIAQLLRARMMQRQCRIADSYRLLYQVEQSGTLGRNRSHLLYNYAQSEYYITVLVLNFHYRDGKVATLHSLLAEVEAAFPKLKVDYAQDMALNYALAYGWQCVGESEKALGYCERNFAMLRLPAVFCRYHYANTLQMAAEALRSMPGEAPPDSVLSLYDEARKSFFDYGDPYQMLGGVTSTSHYALLVGDTAAAHRVLGDWMAMRGVWTPFTAPKLEVSLFDALIRSRYAAQADENRDWYEKRCKLQDYVAQNEREDFDLQQGLEAAMRRSRWLTVAAVTFGALLVLLVALSVLLWVNSLRLRREKRQLETANRRDVERIAGVETCLSVMRHDISPFIGFLRKPDLTPELRDEVLGQLLRTFDNIKGWTRLSVPEGLAFRAENFALQEAFDEVRGQVARPREEVSLRFDATPLRLWGDRLLVVILLRNLVANAVQHTERGSVTVSAAKAEDGMVDIAVSDTGCGMTDEQVESLFRADRVLPEGSEHGFGLILCRYIIKKHDDLTRRGCKMRVESTPGSGTTVHVVLSSANNPQR